MGDVCRSTACAQATNDIEQAFKSNEGARSRRNTNIERLQSMQILSHLMDGEDQFKFQVIEHDNCLREETVEPSMSIVRMKSQHMNSEFDISLRVEETEREVKLEIQDVVQTNQVQKQPEQVPSKEEKKSPVEEPLKDTATTDVVKESPSIQRDEEPAQQKNKEPAKQKIEEPAEKKKDEPVEKQEEKPAEAVQNQADAPKQSDAAAPAAPIKKNPLAALAGGKNQVDLQKLIKASLEKEINTRVATIKDPTKAMEVVGGDGEEPDLNDEDDFDDDEFDSDEQDDATQAGTGDKQVEKTHSDKEKSPPTEKVNTQEQTTDAKKLTEAK